MTGRINETTMATRDAPCSRTARGVKQRRGAPINLARRRRRRARVPDERGEPAQRCAPERRTAEQQQRSAARHISGAPRSSSWSRAS